MKKSGHRFSTFRRLVTKYIQLLLWFLFRIFFLKYYYRIKTSYEGQLDDVKSKTLIVANHQSRTDPFLIPLSLPLKTYWRMIPFAFPSASEVYYNQKFNPKIFPIMSILGCFPVGRSAKEKASQATSFELELFCSFSSQMVQIST